MVLSGQIISITPHGPQDGMADAHLNGIPAAAMRDLMMRDDVVSPATSRVIVTDDQGRLTPTTF